MKYFPNKGIKLNRKKFVHLCQKLKNAFLKRVSVSLRCILIVTYFNFILMSLTMYILYFSSEIFLMFKSRQTLSDPLRKHPLSRHLFAKYMKNLGYR